MYFEQNIIGLLLIIINLFNYFIFLQIDAVPTILFVKENKALDRIDGVDVASLTAKCKKLAGVIEDSKENLETKLKNLINKSNVMIFMKGDRNTPKCGFSKQLINIVNEIG